MMSRTLGVSRSGLYAYHSRCPSARQVVDETLTKRIAAIHKASKETYGAPCFQPELADEGVFVGRKRIERLMQAKGLKGVRRRKFIVTTERDPRARPATDLVDRNFYADAPNLLWVADITFVPTWAGFLYLAVVLDAFSRRVIGWAMGTRQRRTQLVLDAMNMAVAQRKPVSVIHHSDQGS
ncbi:Integrase core domain protein [Roseivivax sp. THAF197b]|nr:Integrase core domain protein [Roseivivax sp. THAF197b]